MRFPACNIAGRDGGPTMTPDPDIIPIRNGADPPRDGRGAILLLPYVEPSFNGCFFASSDIVPALVCTEGLGKLIFRVFCCWELLCFALMIS